MHIANIYGESIVGEEIEYLDQPYKNIIIVEDSNGDKHVVHRETLDPDFKRKPNRAGVRFDLLGCQTHGRKKLQRSKRGTCRKIY